MPNVGRHFHGGMVLRPRYPMLDKARRGDLG